MSILSRLWLRVAHTGHLERMPEPEDGPIAPGIFEEDVDFLKAELALRKHENLKGETGQPAAAEQPERKAKKARKHYRKSQLKERARLQHKLKRLERKQPR